MPRVPICCAIMLALLPGGCCLPAMSGRCEPHAVNAVAKPRSGLPDGKQRHAGDSSGYGDHAGPGHRQGELGRLFARDDGPGTPPGEVVPLPKFHPVPTRPVFEPLPEYSLPQAFIPAAEPLPPAPPAELLPTPAQPVPDPA